MDDHAIQNSRHGRFHGLIIATALSLAGIVACAPGEISVEEVVDPDCSDSDSDGFGNQCAAGEDCDDNDASVYQFLTGYTDSDDDGYGTGTARQVCSGATLPAGFSAEAGDCDDSDPAHWDDCPGCMDADHDGYGAGCPAGGDCDDNDVSLYQLLTGYVDADGDGHGAGESQQVCSGHDLPVGFSGQAGDCDDNDPARWDDCSGCTDEDGDGYGEGCPSGADCDDRDGALFQLLTGYTDADGDGYGTGAAQEVCSGAALPAGFADQVGDCDDQDPDRWDDCSGCTDEDGDGYGDGCPSGADCDDRDGALFQLLTGYSDTDGDGYGTGLAQEVCSGAALPAGFADQAGDCDDHDPASWDDCNEEVDDLPGWFQRARVQIHTRFHMVPLPSWGSKDWFDESLFFEAPYHVLRLGVGAFTRHFKSADEGAWWDSSVGVSHPNAAGRDLAEELVDIAHRADIHQIAYYLHVSDSWAEATYPDWVAVDRNGIPVEHGRGTFMSLASPYLDFLAVRIRELVQRGADGIYFDGYHVPKVSEGADFSASARSLYTSVFGGDIEAASEASLEELRQEIIRRAFSRLSAEIRSVNPRAIALVSGNQMSLGNMRLFDSVKCEPFMWENYPEHPGFPGLPLALTSMRDAAEGRPPHLWIRPQDARDEKFLGRVLAYGAIYNRDIREFELEQSTHEENPGYAANFTLGRKVGPYFVGARPLGWVRVYLDQSYVVAKQNLPADTTDAFVDIKRAGLSPGIILGWQIEAGVPEDCEVVVFPEHTSAPPGLAAALAQLEARGGTVLFSQELSGDWVSGIESLHPPVKGAGGSGKDFVVYRIRGDNRLVIAIANGQQSGITIELEPGFQPVEARDIVEGVPLTISSLGGGKYSVSVPDVPNMTLVVIDDEPIGVAEIDMLDRLDSDSSAITYLGSWSEHANAYGYDSGGSVRRSTTPGSQATAEVFGTCVALGIRKGPLGGRINLSIDGDLVLDGYDTYAGAGRFQQVVYADCGLAAANHEVVFEAAGRAVGEVIRLEDNSTSISYNGTWHEAPNVNDSGSMVWRSNQAEASATTRFSGTCVRVGIRKGPLGGKINLYVDGECVLPAHDTYSPTGVFQHVVYDNCSLVGDSHSVVFEATGQKNPLSGDAYAMLDFIEFEPSTSLGYAMLDFIGFR